MFQNLLLAFIPIFVAVDAIGVLPIFVSLTQNSSPKEKQHIIIQSIFTALSLAIGFIFIGKGLFRFLGITIYDFMIAGGIILFCIAITDLLYPGKKRRIPAGELGAVPLGTPLIVGPAVLTSSLMIVGDYGIPITIAALVLNIAIVGVAFIYADRLMKVLGKNGTQALSKIMALLLAAIGVMMVRKGISSIIIIMNQ